MGKTLKVAALAGGVGGAKLANGLSKILSSENLSIIVNTGDDFEYFGLYICPDLDTVIYNLAGINNPVTGWGIADDSNNVLEGLRKFGHSPWFNLGDLDIATHIERTQALREGELLSKITQRLANSLGIQHTIIPMSETPVRTHIHTKDGLSHSFQDYFVKHQSRPEIREIIYQGIENAILPDQAKKHLAMADLIVICPSNPYLSIDPILLTPGVRELIADKKVVAVSPLIGGKTLKGPAAKIMSEFGLSPTSHNIAAHYGKLLSGFILDSQDQHEKDAIRGCGIIPLVTDILMPDVNAQLILAQQVLDFGCNLVRDMQI